MYALWMRHLVYTEMANCTEIFTFVCRNSINLENNELGL